MGEPTTEISMPIAEDIGEYTDTSSSARISSPISDPAFDVRVFPARQINRFGTKSFIEDKNCSLSLMQTMAKISPEPSERIALVKKKNEFPFVTLSAIANDFVITVFDITTKIIAAKTATVGRIEFLPSLGSGIIRYVIAAKLCQYLSHKGNGCA